MEFIRDVMTEDVECATLLDNVYEVALKMKELNVGAIPIVDDGVLVGMITDRDIAIRGVAEKRPNSSKVEKIMSDTLITVSPQTTTEDAAVLMSQHKIRRLPVIDNGKLVGMVSLGDFAIRQFSDEQAKKALSEISEHSTQHYQQ